MVLNCVRQNIPLRRRRDSAKNDSEVGKSDLTNPGNIVELSSTESRVGIETLRTIFRILHENFMFCCLSLDLFVVFVVFQGKL